MSHEQPPFDLPWPLSAEIQRCQNFKLVLVAPALQLGSHLDLQRYSCESRCLFFPSSFCAQRATCCLRASLDVVGSAPAPSRKLVPSLPRGRGRCLGVQGGVTAPRAPGGVAASVGPTPAHPLCTPTADTCLKLRCQGPGRVLAGRLVGDVKSLRHPLPTVYFGRG
jgi:hypothetical protein